MPREPVTGSDRGPAASFDSSPGAKFRAPGRQRGGRRATPASPRPGIRAEAAAAPTGAASPAPARRRRAAATARARASPPPAGPAARARRWRPSATIACGRTSAISRSSQCEAGRRFLLRRRLVHAALAAQFVLEMLDRVGDVDLLARPARAAPARGRAAGPPARRRAARAGLPGRRAARRPTSARASTGPSPNTACVACSPMRAVAAAASAWRRARARRGGRRRSPRQRFRATPACSGRRPTRRPAREPGCARRRRWALRSCAPLRARRPAASGAISSASGRLLPVAARHLLLHHLELQPRRVEDVLVVGEPQRLAGVGGRRILRVARRARTASVSPSQRRCARASGWPSASARSGA